MVPEERFPEAEEHAPPYTLDALELEVEGRENSFLEKLLALEEEVALLAFLLG